MTRERQLRTMVGVSFLYRRTGFALKEERKWTGRPIDKTWLKRALTPERTDNSIDFGFSGVISGKKAGSNRRCDDKSRFTFIDTVCSSRGDGKSETFPEPSRMTRTIVFHDTRGKFRKK